MNVNFGSIGVPPSFCFSFHCHVCGTPALHTQLMTIAEKHEPTCSGASQQFCTSFTTSKMPLSAVSIPLHFSLSFSFSISTHSATPSSLPCKFSVPLPVNSLTATAKQRPNWILMKSCPRSLEVQLAWKTEGVREYRVLGLKGFGTRPPLWQNGAARLVRRNCIARWLRQPQKNECFRH